MSETSLVPFSGELDIYNSPDHFTHLQRVAKVFSQSKMVPEVFRGGDDAAIANCVIAMNMARRLKAEPLAVMQNLYVVHGKPAWSSQFIMGCINSCGRFTPLRFEIEKLEVKTVEYEYTRYVGDQKKRETGNVTIQDMRCIAWATERGSDSRLESPPVTVEMAVKDGWYTKLDSKWKTMPELMLRYRAATFFGRLYASEILLGMRTLDEMVDISESGTVNRNDIASAIDSEIPQIKTAVVTEVKTDPPAEAKVADTSDPRPKPSEMAKSLGEYINKECGATFDQFAEVVRSQYPKTFPKMVDWQSFDDISESDAKKLWPARRDFKGILTNKTNL